MDRIPFSSSDNCIRSPGTGVAKTDQIPAPPADADFHKLSGFLSTRLRGVSFPFVKSTGAVPFSSQDESLTSC